MEATARQFFNWGSNLIYTAFTGTLPLHCTFTITSSFQPLSALSRSRSLFSELSWRYGNESGAAIPVLFFIAHHSLSDGPVFDSILSCRFIIIVAIIHQCVFPSVSQCRLLFLFHFLLDSCKLDHIFGEFLAFIASLGSCCILFSASSSFLFLFFFPGGGGELGSKAQQANGSMAVFFLSFFMRPLFLI
jgi:hypothetical protein